MNNDSCLFSADVKFKVNGIHVKFRVIHNLPETQGLDFYSALENWVYRTKKYTAKSLCDYIMSKNTGSICMTVYQYNKLNN